MKRMTRTIALLCALALLAALAGCGKDPHPYTKSNPHTRPNPHAGIRNDCRDDAGAAAR